MSQSSGLFSILCLFLAYSSAQAWRPVEFPSVVDVGDTSRNHLGGGTLLSNYAVLTAWKVVEARNESQIIVQYDQWDNWYGHVTRMYRRVRTIVRHPDFNQTSGAYNVALLFLREPVASSPINLATPTSISNLDLYRCLVKSLVEAISPLPVVKSGACQKKLRPWLGVSFRLDGSLMCAGGGIAMGIGVQDGYPLLCPLASDPAQFQQVGIVNWHINRGKLGTPGVFTNVVLLHDWINQQVILNPYSDRRMIIM